MDWSYLFTLVMVGLSGAIPAILAYRRGEMAAMMAERNAAELARNAAKIDTITHGNGHDYSLLYGQISSVNKRLTALEKSVAEIALHLDRGGKDFPA
jgi:hypothetical protein